MHAALSGFKNIDVIDMDTIDVSNLNRQFLFRCVPHPGLKPHPAHCERRGRQHYAPCRTHGVSDCFSPRTNPLLIPVSMVDVGKSKAEVAAERVMQRVAGLTVTPHFCRIEHKPPEWYQDFHIIVLGLDSLEVRCSRPSTT